MLSLYIHIPFCRHKCAYCSFHVIPEDIADQQKITDRKEECLQLLIQESIQRKQRMGETPLKTLHIGGGTPFQLGAQRLEALVDHVLEMRDCEFLEELTIELNPDPIPEVLAMVEHFQEKYKKLYKLRFSFGIQTFDDELLNQSGRNYSYEQIQDFFRSLRTLKKHHGISYNADFIAFGTQKLGKEQWDFFRNVLHAKLFDSFSLYTLELFPGSHRWNESQHMTSSNSPLRGTDEEIIDEFYEYLGYISDAGYKRYEISNFSLLGKRSIHNMVYRTHGSYIGLGPSAASFLTGEELEHYKTDPFEHLPVASETTGLRWKNSLTRDKRKTSEGVLETEQLDNEALMDEKLMLGLRIDHGIRNLSEYSSLLAQDYQHVITERVEQDLATYTNDTLKLTDSGMSVYNLLLTQLIGEQTHNKSI